MSGEVIIVGGGLVGALAAALLGARGTSVTLIDRAAPARQRGRLGLDIRNVAISPASQQLLAQAGVWASLQPAPYRHMHVWEERGTEALAFAAEDLGRVQLGWICEHSEIVCALWDRLQELPNVECCAGELPQELMVESGQVRLRLGDGVRNASLLIGADGHQSWVRQSMRVPLRETPTGHHALATMVRVAGGHRDTAWQRFLLAGPLALLPSAEPDLASVVWSQPASLAASRKSASDADFCSELESLLEGHLGAVTAVDDRFVFPISQMLLKNFNPQPRVLLLGDAAHAIHPLAGLGANLGFEDVRDLVNRVDRLGAVADLGADGLWTSYARQRRARAKLLLTLMAGLQKAYAASDPLRGWLRNAGVGLIDHSSLLKTQLVREAMGLGPLAKGLGVSS